MNGSKVAAEFLLTAMVPLKDPEKPEGVMRAPAKPTKTTVKSPTRSAMSKEPGTKVP
jgi:hypothetical protein